MNDREVDLAFIRALANTRGFDADSTLLRRHLAALFGLEQVDLQGLWAVATRALKQQPRFGRLVEEASRASPSDFGRKLQSGDLLDALDDPLCHGLLRKTIVQDLELERLLTRLRCTFLRAGGGAEDRFSAGQWRVMASLACQAFNNEYIYSLESGEQAELEQLRATVLNRLQARDCAGLAAPLLICAMYAPLSTFEFRETILKVACPQQHDFDEVVARQIRDRMAEEEIRAQLPSFGMSGEATTQRVRQQYEESPYPRWIDLTAKRPRPFAEFQADRFPFLEPVRYARPVQMLIAGCGTGYTALKNAAKYSDVDVLGIDVSKASLAYAGRQARRYGIRNIEFRHGDLLCPDRLNRRFDVIEVAGVLHHLADPLAGYRALLEVLNPGGLMFVALYSRRARERLAPAKLLAAEEPYSTPYQIREFRRKLITNNAGNLEMLARSFDFFYLSGFRDLLCHVHEVLFTPAELKSFVQGSEVSFLGYNLDAEGSKAYCRRFPDDPYVRDLAKLEQFEIDNPDMNWSLHEFWIRKNVGSS
jgi:SAM-dependent methyltransferase